VHNHQLEADRISFSFFFGVIFFGRKRHPPFRFFSFLRYLNGRKSKKKKVSTLAEAMHGGQNSESPQSHTAAVGIATRSA